MEVFLSLSLLLSAFLVPVFVILFQSKQYKKTSYYKITQSTYSSVKRDKGKYGEYLTYKYLQRFEQDGAKFVFNVYVPRMNMGTSEIDALLICSKGVLVFESKNYSGWIFGDEIQKEWTQTLPQGRGSRKERFYNPVMQNASHIKHLKHLIGENVPVRSIIVFSERCTLKSIKIRSNSVCVVNRYDVLSAVNHIHRITPEELLTPMEINVIYEKLFPYTQVGYDTKERHISNIKK